MGNVFRATRATRMRSLGVTSPRFAERPPTLGGAPTGFAFPALPAMHGEGTTATRGEGTAATRGEEPQLCMVRERRLRVVRSRSYAW